MQPTNVANPAYFHKVVDCQWACPAHTPVPEYIRLIGQGRYSDAYMINWVSNVFPGVLGRTCDRPCEPACRRGRVEEKPVAICRLKRVAADYKGDIDVLMPEGQIVWTGGARHQLSFCLVEDLDLVRPHTPRAQDEELLELLPDPDVRYTCHLYTSPSPRDRTRPRMPASA